ncbi:MAG: prolyl oligopeptidase family serine peptidase [Candidatus Saccharimonadales bacterium]
MNNMNQDYKYPKTKIKTTNYALHGVKIDDPYMWLEEESNPEVAKWVKSQNQFTDKWFEGLDVSKIAKELKEDLDAHSKGTPWRCKNKYFWYERKPGQDHYVLYTGPKPYHNKQILFDVNQLSDDSSISLSFFSISKNAKYAVYGISDSGSERDEIFILNLTSGRKEKFYFGRFFDISWCDDEKGFYYMRSDYKSYSEDIAEETHYQQIYYHKLGDGRDQDELVFNGIDYLPKDAHISPHVSEDGKHLLVNAYIGWVRSRIFLVDTTASNTKELLKDINTTTLNGSLLDNYLYLTTDFMANNRRVLRIKVEDIDKPIDAWEEFIPEKQEKRLELWLVTKSRAILAYSHNATSLAEILDRKNGEFLEDLNIEDLSSILMLSTNEDYEEFFYSVSTFFEPATKYRFNPSSKKVETLWKDERSIDTNKFTAKQVWFRSTDKTKVPMFIIGPKTISKDGSNPVLLTGYGGFGLSLTPDFLGDSKPWLERGGIVAIPNLRGGDEFGDKWHKDGMLDKKQNVFDDMNSAAEHLIEQGVTAPKKIAINGGSNGGLLVGACINQRPDLYGAAVAQVPLLDMLRFHKFLMAHRWTHEYGNPDDKDAFEWIKDYSPYHNIDPNKEYPPILFTAGMHDSRVHPMNAWKMAAKMQALSQENIVLMRTETKAGHGQGKGFYQAVNDQAEILVFMMKNVGINI